MFNKLFSFISRPQNRRFIIIGSLLSLIVLIVFLSKSENCTVSDFRFKSKVETNAYGFTKDAACERALITCKAYSSWPDECRVKE